MHLIEKKDKLSPDFNVHFKFHHIWRNLCVPQEVSAHQILRVIDVVVLEL